MTSSSCSWASCMPSPTCRWPHVNFLLTVAIQSFEASIRLQNKARRAWIFYALCNLLTSKLQSLRCGLSDVLSLSQFISATSTTCCRPATTVSNDRSTPQYSHGDPACPSPLPAISVSATASAKLVNTATTSLISAHQHSSSRVTCPQPLSSRVFS